MTVLPLIERELRVRSRSSTTHWSRFGAVLVGTLICLPAFTFTSSQFQQSNIGPGVFTGMIGAAFLMCCAGCLLTADTISSERREGTLGLLLLTRVRHVDVLLGKLTSKGATSLLLLVAFLPLLAIPVLAGGVTGGEALRSGLALVNALFLALAVGLWASALQTEKGKAMCNAALPLIGIVVLPWVWGVLPPGEPIADLGLLSPFRTLLQAADRAYKLSPSRYWVSLAWVSLAGLAFLYGALRAMRRRSPITFAQDDNTVSVSWPVLVPEPPASFHPKMTWQDAQRPLHWLVRQQRGIRWPIWLGAVSAALLNLVFSGVSTGVVNAVGSAMYLGVLLSAVSLAFAAIQTTLFAWPFSRFFIESRRTGELELLLTLPGASQEIVTAQWDVLKRLCLWPLVVMLIPKFLQAVLALYRFSSISDHWLGAYLLSSVLLGTLSAVALLYALGRVALWAGMRASGQVRALLWTLMWVTGLPYLLSLLVQILSSLLLAVLANASGGFSPAVLWPIYLVSPVAHLLFFLWLARFARLRLHRLLTGTAAEPFSLAKSLPQALTFASSTLRRARHWTPSS